MSIISTPHMKNKIGDIAKTVIMPGDPLRAKYISEKYLENVRIVNTVRNNLGYTGYYKGKEVTVFSSGMGIPSMGIYAYELYKFHNVEKIIRIGSCGSKHEGIKLLDIILADEAYSLSTFPKIYAADDINKISATKELTDYIEEVIKEQNIEYKRGLIITSDVFDPYIDYSKYKDPFPKDLNSLGNDMETFCLFYLAHKLNKQAASLLTVSDSLKDNKEITSEEREKKLDKMIKIALESL